MRTHSLDFLLENVFCSHVTVPFQALQSIQVPFLPNSDKLFSHQSLVLTGGNSFFAAGPGPEPSVMVPPYITHNFVVSLFVNNVCS